ncbi:MAG: hypothetical protein HZB13_09305 [Acidobacteria bacterium]|nr:hypothetical protein [Acidobacteriota bacterium]
MTANLHLEIPAAKVLQATVRSHASQVAGEEDAQAVLSLAVPETSVGQFRIPPVTQRAVTALHCDFAHMPAFDGLAILAEQQDIHVFHRVPNRQDAARDLSVSVNEVAPGNPRLGCSQPVHQHAVRPKMLPVQHHVRW